MDRFKFRVWNIEHGLYCDQMAEMVINSDGVCYDNGVSADYFKHNGFIIEQCTGLKDKNGNLIYEGDIIKAPKASDKFMQILFNEYCFECFDPDTHQYILSLSVVELVSKSKNIEIIGNIHKQPEQKDVK